MAKRYLDLITTEEKPAAAAPVETAPTDQPDATPPAPAAPVAPPAPAISTTTYRVAEKWKGSLDGTITKLAKGKLINTRHYGGDLGLDRLLAAGVKLERT